MWTITIIMKSALNKMQLCCWRPLSDPIPSLSPSLGELWFLWLGMWLFFQSEYFLGRGLYPTGRLSRRARVLEGFRDRRKTYFSNHIWISLSKCWQKTLTRIALPRGLNYVYMSTFCHCYLHNHYRYELYTHIPLL